MHSYNGSNEKAVDSPYLNNETIFDKIKGFLFSPTVTFKKIKDEEFIESFKYYIILGATIYAILTVLFSFLFQYLLTSFVTYSPAFLGSTSFISSSYSSNIIPALLALFVVIMYLIIFVTLLVGLFIGGLWVHLWVYVLGGRKGMTQTLKGYAYGSTPTLIFGWIPVIGAIFSLWSLGLYIIGVRELHEISTGRAIAAVLISILIPIILVIIVAAVVYVYVSGMLPN